MPFPALFIHYFFCCTARDVWGRIRCCVGHMWCQKKTSVFANFSRSQYLQLDKVTFFLSFFFCFVFIFGLHHLNIKHAVLIINFISHSNFYFLFWHSSVYRSMSSKFNDCSKCTVQECKGFSWRHRDLWPLLDPFLRQFWTFIPFMCQISYVHLPEKIWKSWTDQVVCTVSCAGGIGFVVQPTRCCTRHKFQPL